MITRNKRRTLLHRMKRAKQLKKNHVRKCVRPQWTIEVSNQLSLHNINNNVTQFMMTNKTKNKKTIERTNEQQKVEKKNRKYTLEKWPSMLCVHAAVMQFVY